MKKILSIICITILLFLTLINSTYANINVNLKAPTMVAKDQEFEIIVETDVDLLGVGFTFNYDEELLEFVRVEGPESGINTSNQNKPGEVTGALANLEVSDQPYKIIFKALKDKKTATIKVSKLDITVKDETAEHSMKQETNIKVEDLKIKLVKESELAEGDNMQTIERTNSAYIYIIIAVVAVVLIVVIVLIILKKKKKK